MLLGSLRQLRCLRLLPTASSGGACARHLCSLSQSTQQQLQPPVPAVEPPEQRPKLHWSEEFKIRSPKVPPGRLRSEPVVAIDIESDAFADRRVAFVLRRSVTGGPAVPRWRGVAKILSWCSLSSLPYLMFCKWAGGTPLLGEMATYAIPTAVAGVSLGYLGLNLALERAVLGRRVYTVALDETDPELVYITTLPTGGWLHGHCRSYVTRLDNISVEMGRGSWAKLTFKSGELKGDWLSLPVGRRKCFVIDARAMAVFQEACNRSAKPPPASEAADAASSASSSNLSDEKHFDRVVLPSEAEINRHLESALGGQAQQPESGPAKVDEAGHRQQQEEQQK